MFVLLKIAEIRRSSYLPALSLSLSLCFSLLYSALVSPLFDDVKNDFVRKHDAARARLNDDVHFGYFVGRFSIVCLLTSLTFNLSSFFFLTRSNESSITRLDHLAAWIFAKFLQLDSNRSLLKFWNKSDFQVLLSLNSTNIRYYNFLEKKKELYNNKT